MHIPTPSELKAKRVALGLKQADVASRAGISQSMVARIEAGTVDPRISTLAKIVQVLNVAERPAMTAADVMHAPVLSVTPNDTIAKAVEILEENDISQLPVIENDVPVGCISENSIVEAIGQDGMQKKNLRTVRDYMETSFPTLSLDTDIETVVHILHQHHAVLVVDEGKVRGVITKHDLISLIV
ncbi:MAG: CBS domain-containing protein [Methanobacteriota archaeon]|nr:MAG: CBS domain-containing protein [Euryarchaeota archaeon]